MQQSKAAYFADLTVYPILIALMCLVIADVATPLGCATALGVAIGGAVLWALLGTSLPKT